MSKKPKKYSFAWYLREVDIIKFIKYNYFSKCLERDKDAYFYPMKGAKLDISDSARIKLHSNFTLGNNRIAGSKRESYLIMGDKAVLNINGEVLLNYGVHLQVHKNAVISIGKAVINTDSVIIAEKEIEIGNDVIMGRFVTIFDSDFHPIHDENGNRTNAARKVTIGDHVWLGTKATILKGTKIKNGAVISASTLVGGIVKENALFSSIPGQMFGTVEWGKPNKK